MRFAGALGALVIFVGILMILPGSFASPADSDHPTAPPRNLAADPSGYPPANYSNPTIGTPPAVPDTTPVLLSITSYGTVSIPHHDWETVVMNYTGYTAGTAYDYFQTVTIDGAMVYVGVNPEAGRWTQFVNLSAYLVFFDDRSNITISGPHLGNGSNFEGVQINNITLEFYPIPKGGHSPAYAGTVEPLFAFAGTPASTNITIPSDASAVELQMIGIGSEFWYSLNPDFTAVTVAIGGRNVSSYLQYPWINSGGIDLFSWRPIAPVHMLDHQWETFNLTAALGWIEGTHTLTVSASAGALGADVIANLLVFTSPHVKRAVGISYAYDQAPVETVSPTNSSLVNTNGNNFTYYNQTDRIVYGYASEVLTSTGHYDVSLATIESYANYQSLTAVWQNITMLERVATVQTTTYAEKGYHGTVVTSQELVYPLAMQIGEVLVYVSSQGDLTFYNYTSYFDDVTQGYLEYDQTAASINGVWSSSFQYVDDRIFDTDGYFASVLEISPYFAIILNITASLHTTNAVDIEIAGSASPHYVSYSYYASRLSGHEDNSTSYYVQETLVLDRTVSYSYHLEYGRR
jgi:hypothetical protein